MRVYKSFSELVGKTPLIEVDFGTKARILCKLEYFNPAGSAKDRIALYMIDEAEKSGALKSGGVIVEPTSGNTGIGLAAVAASRGYRAIFTMPDTMSVERRKLLAAYGAELVLTEGSLGMSGAIKKAEELTKTIRGAFMPSQFTNPMNPKAHEMTTGPEIFEDTDGLVDIFVATVGTGGTVSGTGHYLKSKNEKIRIVGVEPSDSPVISGGKPGKHKIQGIGAGFIPDTLDKALLDEIMTVTSQDAFEYGRLMAQKNGILVGISSGACISAAIELANREENAGKIIVALLTDTGERYLSSEMFG